MKIYFYDNGWNTLMNCIYAIGAIVFAVAFVFAFIRLVLPLIFSKKKEKKTPLCASAILTVLLIVLLSIPLIGCVGFSNLFFESVAYENDMKNGKAQILVGEVELLSCQEVYTRGNGLHYVVELRIGEQTISPLNGFNKEHLEYFQSGEKMSIEYGIIQGEGLYIWSIKVLQNNE